MIFKGKKLNKKYDKESKGKKKKKKKSLMVLGYLDHLRTFKPITRPSSEMENWRVSELIVDGDWRRDLIEESLWDVDKEVIYRIPLSDRGWGDMIVTKLRNKNKQ